jgi:hypothetical protein
VVEIFKRVASFLKMDPKDVATEDLLALNIDLASVMQAGGGIAPACPCVMGQGRDSKLENLIGMTPLEI